MPHYVRADEEVEPIALELMREHHGHLLSARFGYLFVDKAPRSKGRLVLASVCLFPEKFQPFFPDGEERHFLLTVSLDVWNRAQLSQRIALIDHELSHCWGEEDGTTDDDSETGTGEMKWSIVGHDFEEFVAVVRRHGVWKQDLELAREVLAKAAPILPGLPDLTREPLCEDDDGQPVYEDGSGPVQRGKRKKGRGRLFGRKRRADDRQVDLEELISEAKKKGLDEKLTGVAVRLVQGLSTVSASTAIALIQDGIEKATDKDNALTLFANAERTGLCRAEVLGAIERMWEDLTTRGLAKGPGLAELSTRVAVSDAAHTAACTQAVRDLARPGVDLCPWIAPDPCDLWSPEVQDCRSPTCARQTREGRCASRPGRCSEGVNRSCVDEQGEDCPSLRRKGCAGAVAGWPAELAAPATQKEPRT